MKLTEYAEHDAVGLAGLVRDGQTSGAELLSAALAATDLLNPVLNFVAHDLRAAASDLVRNGVPAGPFSGVPFLVKDLSMEMAGAPAECGSRLLAGRIAERDHNLMTRFEQAMPWIDRVPAVHVSRTNAKEART